MLGTVKVCLYHIGVLSDDLAVVRGACVLLAGRMVWILVFDNGHVEHVLFGLLHLLCIFNLIMLVHLLPIMILNLHVSEVIHVILFHRLLLGLIHIVLHFNLFHTDAELLP